MFHGHVALYIVEKFLRWYFVPDADRGEASRNKAAQMLDHNDTERSRRLY
jgi:hypothetical protein